MKVGYKHEHPSLRSLSSHDYSLLTTLGGALFLEVLQYQVDAWSRQGKPLFHLTAVLSGCGRRDLRCCGGPFVWGRGHLSVLTTPGLLWLSKPLPGGYSFSYQQVSGVPQCILQTREGELEFGEGLRLDRPLAHAIQHKLLLCWQTQGDQGVCFLSHVPGSSALPEQVPD